MANITYGPKLGKLINANIGDSFTDDFRTFLRAFDTLVQGTVVSAHVVTPPVSPLNGDSYILLHSSSPSGVWTGHNGQLAVYTTEITQSGTNNKTPGWEFYSPHNGWLFYSTNDACFFFFNGTEWVQSNLTSAAQVTSASLTISTALATPAYEETVLLCTGGVSGITITLPSPSLCANAKFTVKKTDSGAGAVTIAPHASEFVEGDVSYTLVDQYQRVTLISDGANWWVLSAN